MNEGAPNIDPHVLTAIFCLLLAVMVVFGLYIVNLVNEEEAKKRRRGPFDKDK